MLETAVMAMVLEIFVSSSSGGKPDVAGGLAHEVSRVPIIADEILATFQGSASRFLLVEANSQIQLELAKKKFSSGTRSYLGSKIFHCLNRKY